MPLFLKVFFFFLTEKGDARTKIDALKKVIQMILNGEKMPSLLMIIIRFVMPMQDHTIKKLLLVFWEVVPKYTPEGKLLQEFILVCDAYRKVCNVLATCMKMSCKPHSECFNLECRMS